MMMSVSVSLCGVREFSRPLSSSSPSSGAGEARANSRNSLSTNTHTQEINSRGLRATFPSVASDPFHEISQQTRLDYSSGTYLSARSTPSRNRQVAMLGRDLSRSPVDQSNVYEGQIYLPFSFMAREKITTATAAAATSAIDRMSKKSHNSHVGFGLLNCLRSAVLLFRCRDFDPSPTRRSVAEIRAMFQSGTCPLLVRTRSSQEESVLSVILHIQ